MNRLLAKYVIRLAAVAVAVGLSLAQFQLFDCNKVPALSVASGTLTLLLLYVIGEVIHSVATSPRSARDKLLIGVVVALGGGALVAVAGFFTLITHLCP